MRGVLSGHSARRVGRPATTDAITEMRWDHVQFNFQQILSKLKNFRTIPELWTLDQHLDPDLGSGDRNDFNFIYRREVNSLFFLSYYRTGKGLWSDRSKLNCCRSLAYVVVNNNVVIKNEIIEKDFNNLQFFLNSFQKFNYSRYHIKVLLNFSE